MQNVTEVINDYVKALWLWLMLQQDESDDYVIVIVETHTVRGLVEITLS
jgi:GDP-D-mannose dehydratase